MQLTPSSSPPPRLKLLGLLALLLAAKNQEEHMHLSDRNSILMMWNLSRIWSVDLIGQHSSCIVLPIVYEWQTKGREGQM